VAAAAALSTMPTDLPGASCSTPEASKINSMICSI
jgi:hypothetical protein